MKTLNKDNSNAQLTLELSQWPDLPSAVADEGVGVFGPGGQTSVSGHQGAAGDSHSHWTVSWPLDPHHTHSCPYPNACTIWYLPVHGGVIPQRAAILWQDPAPLHPQETSTRICFPQICAAGEGPHVHSHTTLVTYLSLDDQEQRNNIHIVPSKIPKL